MKWSVGTKIISGFGLSLALFTVIGAVSFETIGRLTATSDMVMHTRKVRFALRDLLSQLQDIETGTRGYI